MHRKITRTGPATLTIALPSKWVKENNLTPGQEIKIEEINNKLELSLDDEEFIETKRIPYDETFIENMLEKLFLESTTNIIIFSDKLIPKTLNEIVNKFPGLQIIEQENNKVVIQKILTANIQDKKTLLRRCYIILKEKIEENPPKFSSELNQILLLLTSKKHNSKEIFILREIYNTLLECNKALHDDAYYLFKKTFNEIYKQKYNYSSIDARKLAKQFDKVEQLFVNFFKQDTEYILLSKIYTLMKLLKQLHNEIINEHGIEVLTKINKTNFSRYKVGVCFVNEANIYWNEEVRNSMQEQLVDNKEIEFIFESPLSNVEVEAQDEILKHFIDIGVDAIIYVPINPKALSETITKINSLNIPLLVLDTDLEQKNKQYSFIGFDNFKGGFITAENLIKKIKKKSTILIIEGYPFGTSPIRIEGFKKALNDEDFKIKTIKGEFQQSISYTNTLNFLNNNKVDAIFATNDTMAIGAIKAVKVLGLKIPVCGFDMTEEGKKALENGDLLSTINTKPRFLGELATKQIKDILKNNNIPEKTQYSIELVIKK